MPTPKKKKRVGSVIFRIVLIVIAGLTVGLGVFSWNASGLVGNKLPMPFGYGVSVIMSPSMEPVLKTNDLVFVTEQDSYAVDDIIVYQEGNMLIIHRIVNIDGDTVVTKGDANNVADNPISMSDIKAKLSFRIPFIGVIFKYIKTVPGTLLILVLAVFLLYRSRQKERDSDREELDQMLEEIRRLRQEQSSAGTGEAKADDTAVPTEEQPTDSSDISNEPNEAQSEITDNAVEAEQIPVNTVSPVEELPAEASDEVDESNEAQSETIDNAVEAEQPVEEPQVDTAAAAEPVGSAESVFEDNSREQDEAPASEAHIASDLAEVESILEEMS